MEKKQVFWLLGGIILITLAIILYIIFVADEYIVKFDSNGGSSVSNQTIRTGGNVEMPSDPTRDGFVFVEWQLDGESFDFNTKVRRNLTLVASWQRVADSDEILYTIVFDSSGGSEVSDQRVPAGETVVKPTNPVRSGYTFEGWFSGNSAFDFNSLVMSDLELTARWKRAGETTEPDNAGGSGEGTATEFKVGDRVRIIGAYAESSTSTNARHTRANGWQRIVLRVHEGKEFPYQVGNRTGTTGFFKAESLEKM